MRRLSPGIWLLLLAVVVVGAVLVAQFLEVL